LTDFITANVVGWSPPILGSTAHVARRRLSDVHPLGSPFLPQFPLSRDITRQSIPSSAYTIRVNSPGLACIPFFLLLLAVTPFWFQSGMQSVTKPDAPWTNSVFLLSIAIFWNSTFFSRSCWFFTPSFRVHDQFWPR